MGIAILGTFFLTATLFLIIPTRSQNSKFDPWLDTNDDGTINILDISASAKAFGSSGDSTKYVYVTNPSYDAESTWISIGWTNYTGTARWGYSPSGYGFTLGFSKLFIHLYVITYTSPKPVDQYFNTTVYVSSIAWNSSALLSSYEPFDPNRCNVTIDNRLILSSVGEFEIKAETIEYITFKVTSTIHTGSFDLQVCTYLRND